MGYLSNATAIGSGCIVNVSNKVRVGNGDVIVIEGQVGFTSSSDRNKKENFGPSPERKYPQSSEIVPLIGWSARPIAREWVWG